jgi:hypothetical protein
MSIERNAAAIEYVQMITAMKPELKVNPRFEGVLLDFLNILMTRQDFEVNVEEIVRIFKLNGFRKRESNLKKYLLSLKKGRDYIQTAICPRTGQHKLCEDLPPHMTRGGYYKKYTWLSLDAFKYLCLRIGKPFQRQLQEYFFLTERLYRNNALQHIEMRQVFEPPIISAFKKRRIYPKFPKGSCAYIISLYDKNGKRVHLKVGWSDDMNERLPELDRIYYPFVVVVEFHMLTNNFPWAVEACGLNSTPDFFRNGLDREIIDGNLEQAIQSIIECDAFMTKQKRINKHTMKPLERQPHPNHSTLFYRSPSLYE